MVELLTRTLGDVAYSQFIVFKRTVQTGAILRVHINCILIVVNTTAVLLQEERCVGKK